MKFIKYIGVSAWALLLLVSCGLGDDPRAEITVVDKNDRPIPSATVEIFARPANTVREDIKFTDEVGTTYHEFVFEGTFDVKAHIDEFTIYNDLVGQGEIILSRDETYRTTITLNEANPDPEEEEDK